MAGQIIRKGDRRFLIRWFVGRDADGKRRYASRTIQGTKKQAEQRLPGGSCRSSFLSWAEARDRSSPHSEVTQIVFPRYRAGGRIRVSEQEARIAFTEAIFAESDQMFSIETPTESEYSFSGQSKVSAQSDLAIHEPDGTVALRVEFKAKGFSEKRASATPIEKDIQKLLEEPVAGLWFHVLESVDSATIPKLLQGLFGSVVSVLRSGTVRNTRLGFHICILEGGYSIQRWEELAVGATDHAAMIKRLAFAPSAERFAEAGAISNGWRIHRS